LGVNREAPDFPEDIGQSVREMALTCQKLSGRVD
jgi:hypothetical protein